MAVAWQEALRTKAQAASQQEKRGVSALVLLIQKINSLFEEPVFENKAAPGSGGLRFIVDYGDVDGPHPWQSGYFSIDPECGVYQCVFKEMGLYGPLYETLDTLDPQTLATALVARVEARLAEQEGLAQKIYQAISLFVEILGELGEEG